MSIDKPKSGAKQLLLVDQMDHVAVPSASNRRYFSKCRDDSAPISEVSKKNLTEYSGVHDNRLQLQKVADAGVWAP